MQCRLFVPLQLCPADSWPVGLPVFQHQRQLCRLDQTHCWYCPDGPMHCGEYRSGQDLQSPIQDCWAVRHQLHQSSTWLFRTVCSWCWSWLRCRRCNHRYHDPSRLSWDWSTHMLHTFFDWVRKFLYLWKKVACWDFPRMGQKMHCPDNLRRYSPSHRPADCCRICLERCN